MKMTSRLALVAAAGMLFGVTSSANAADLGGGCCADLEERVAELEATTARKGNRVVSLQVYGNVSRGIISFDYDDNDDDDDLSDTVLVDEDGSKFGIRGSASLKPGWTAGYRMEFQTDNEQGDDLDIRRNALWIESEQLGRITLGQESTATDGIANVVLANTYQDSGNYFLDLTGTGGDLEYTNFDGGRGDVLRYDSPSIAGFILSATWSDDLDEGEVDTDEYWDVALRYSGEFNAFRVAAGIGYSEEDDDLAGITTEILQGSASIMHVPTGLFAAFSTGELDDGGAEDSYWWASAGIEKSFLAYGKTTFYGEYGEYDDDDPDTLWGAGVTQSFDAAAMDIYAQYRHVEEDDGDDEFDTFTLGANIKF